MIQLEQLETRVVPASLIYWHPADIYANDDWSHAANWRVDSYIGAVSTKAPDNDNWPVFSGDEDCSVDVNVSVPSLFVNTSYSGGIWLENTTLTIISGTGIDASSLLFGSNSGAAFWLQHTADSIILNNTAASWSGNSSFYCTTTTPGSVSLTNNTTMLLTGNKEKDVDTYLNIESTSKLTIGGAAAFPVGPVNFGTTGKLSVKVTGNLTLNQQNPAYGEDFVTYYGSLKYSDSNPNKYIYNQGTITRGGTGCAVIDMGIWSAGGSLNIGSQLVVNGNTGVALDPPSIMSTGNIRLDDDSLLVVPDGLSQTTGTLSLQPGADAEIVGNVFAYGNATIDMGGGVAVSRFVIEGSLTLIDTTLIAKISLGSPDVIVASGDVIIAKVDSSCTLRISLASPLVVSNISTIVHSETSLTGQFTSRYWGRTGTTSLDDYFSNAIVDNNYELTYLGMPILIPPTPPLL